MNEANPALAIVYREAREEDFPAVIELYEKLDAFFRQYGYAFPKVKNVGALWLDSLRRTLGRFSIMYVAEWENEVVAFIVARLKRVPEYMGGVMVGELKDMWVEPKVRRLGIGEKLLGMAIEWCRLQGVHSCEGQIFLENEPSIRLLESFGIKKELYQMRLLWEDYRPH